MTKDYARKPATKIRRRKSEPYFGLWLFTIIIFIAFMFGLVYLGKNRHYEHQNIVNEKITVEHNGTTSINKAPDTMEQQKPKLQFDFDIPKKPENNATITQQKTAETKPIVVKELKYQLDIATVKDYTSVDKLKAQLALLGFEAKVIPVKTHNVYYYKVFTGPYDKKTALEKQRLLKQNKLSAVVSITK